MIIIWFDRNPLQQYVKYSTKLTLRYIWINAFYSSTARNIIRENLQGAWISATSFNTMIYFDAATGQCHAIFRAHAYHYASDLIFTRSPSFNR